jgi:hypothetical protein
MHRVHCRDCDRTGRCLSRPPPMSGGGTDSYNGVNDEGRTHKDDKADSTYHTTD